MTYEVYNAKIFHSKLLTLRYLLHTNPKPLKGQLQILFKIDKGSTQTSEVAEPGFTQIFKLLGKKNIYRVDLFVNHPESGIYYPVFKSGSLRIIGPQLTLEPEYRSVMGILVVSAALVFWIFASFLIFIQKKLAKENTKREQHSFYSYMIENVFMLRFLF